MSDYKELYPFTATRIEGDNQKFNLTDPDDRRVYFEHKIGTEIKKLKEYFSRNTFVAYLLGKKNSGKGTYTKMMMEIFGTETIGHVSVGDVVRSAYQALSDEQQKQELVNYMRQNYRGYISVEDAIEALIGRDAKKLLPTEFILALVKREIDKMPKKTLFIDGFPRDLDQISYSLYFRDLINYRDDSDLFIAIDIPETVIDERMRNRVVCPKCQVPRSLKLLITKYVGWDAEKKEFYLMCDNPACGKARMIEKEGDQAGIESIRDRLELDAKLIDKVFSSLHGVPKILLRNAVPTEFAKNNLDVYELTPEYSFERDAISGEVSILEKPWQLKDDTGNAIHSLMPAAVVVSLVKQLVKVLEI